MLNISLQEWMRLPISEISKLVRNHNITVKVALDGSTRHYLLAHPNDKGIILSFEDYFLHGSEAMLHLLDVLYSCGITNVLLTAIWPGDLDRRDNHLSSIVGGVIRMMLGETAVNLYHRWGIKVTLYGNWDLSPLYEDVRDKLIGLKSDLEQVSSGNRLFAMGFSGGPYSEELIARSIALYEKLGRLPTDSELRRACFPMGPESIDIYVGSGKIVIDNSGVPPLLNHGVSVYSLAHLPLDITENEMRRILYDYLFARSADSWTANVAYTPEMLASLRAYYAEHSSCVVGLGHVIESIFWEPDHAHGEQA